MDLNAAWQQAYRALKTSCLIEEKNLIQQNQMVKIDFPYRGIRAVIMKNAMARLRSDIPLYGT
jgi:hypothetical protein